MILNESITRLMSDSRHDKLMATYETRCVQRHDSVVSFYENTLPVAYKLEKLKDTENKETSMLLTDYWSQYSVQFFPRKSKHC